MKLENKQELYTSPEVEVIEIKARQVMCLSGGYNTDVSDYPSPYDEEEI